MESVTMTTLEPMLEMLEALHRGERTANNVDAQCDKLATELS